MKRIFALILVTVICLSALTSCDTLSKGIRRVFGTDIPNGYLEEAKSVIYFKYKDDCTTDTDRELVSKLIIDEVTVNVEWTTDNELVTVKASEKDGYVILDVPEANENTLIYNLTATMTVPDDVSVITLTLKCTVPVTTGADVPKDEPGDTEVDGDTGNNDSTTEENGDAAVGEGTVE